MQRSISPISCFRSSSLQHCLPLQQVANKVHIQKIVAEAEGTSSLFNLRSSMEGFPAVSAGFLESLNNGSAFRPFPKMAGFKQFVPAAIPSAGIMSPEALLDVIGHAQQRLHDLESVVRMIIPADGQRGIVLQQQQVLSKEVTSVMSWLAAAMAGFSSPPGCHATVSAAMQVHDAFDFAFDGFNVDDLNNTLGGGLFYPLPQSSGMDALATNSEMCEGAGVHFPSIEMGTTDSTRPSSSSLKDQAKGTSSGTVGTVCKPPVGHEHDSQTPYDHREEDEDPGEGESLPPGSYELVEMAATEILAEHTHFCEICSKGFKRDANLRMHMRGHGDEYKTAAALARPDRLPHDASSKPRRYSCPYEGCKRNKKHQKFQPLKTMLCVKNHYRRSHCPKVLVCSRCKSKKFSVVADLKTHEKHCGQEKWQCSCGTTFSRKDKLYGHLGLFAGHSPATPVVHEPQPSEVIGDALENSVSCSKPDGSGMVCLPAGSIGFQGVTGTENEGFPVQNSKMGTIFSFGPVPVMRDSSLSSVSSAGWDASKELQKLLAGRLLHHGQGAK
ncbi:hypothetical protein KP509_03G062400 [Ceratopteris richardii]|uniref:C2H2-type domain-containing protein n=2 Tax=Ceratopteris richardii TaxID=49495 RepID=A0A8T2V7R5_CERRI|nr:hypothetical protein KP509_03G062400 [Ceratopteris richardii]